MKNQLLFFFISSLILSGCSKEESKPDMYDTLRIDYTFSPGGVESTCSFYSNREGRNITIQAGALYTYTDEVRPGDKVRLIMRSGELSPFNQEIRVNLNGKRIFYADNPESGSIPATWVIDETLSKEYFEK